MKEQEEAKEEQQVEERSTPTGRVIYKAILQDGETELERPNASLFWAFL